MSAAPPLRPRRLLAWLALGSLASGLPYALVNDTATLLYRDAGVSLKEVGLLSLVAWAWTLKPLWAVAVDRWASRRAWTVVSQTAIALLLLGVAWLPSTEVTTPAWLLLGALALLSATQDLAVDAYAVDATPHRLLGPVNGVRVTCYRIALVLAGGTLVAQAPALGWRGVWLVAAAAFAALAFISLRLPSAPRTPTTGVPLWEPLRSLLRRPGIVPLLAFVLLFKAGDLAMAPMTKPFLQDLGFTLKEMGQEVAPLVIAATILGSLVGAWATARLGLGRALLALGGLQAVSNLGYAYAAASGARADAWVAAGLEPLCGGMATAPFLALFMLASDRVYVATHFALLTAIFALLGRNVGAGSGAFVELHGYGGWFALTFLLALPAFLLLPAVARWIARRERELAVAQPTPGA